MGSKFLERAGNGSQSGENQCGKYERHSRLVIALCFSLSLNVLHVPECVVPSWQHCFGRSWSSVCKSYCFTLLLLQVDRSASTLFHRDGLCSMTLSQTGPLLPLPLSFGHRDGNDNV